MALMAMTCIEDNVSAGKLRKDLQKAMKRTENNLKSKQATDGTWGFNEISTALATQVRKGRYKIDLAIMHAPCSFFLLIQGAINGGTEWYQPNLGIFVFIWMYLSY